MYCGFGQQQTVYTNYLLNQYVYNPAVAGSVKGTQFNVGYRNQWLGFEGAPKTYMASGYGNFKKRPNMAAGGLVLTERIGLLQRTSFYGTYSYHLKINKKAAIGFGLGIGGVQHSVKNYDARPYDKDDYFLASEVLRGFAFDANAGFYLYSKNFFFGFSNQHMPNGKILWSNSIGRLTSHFYAYSGYNFALDPKKEWVLQPSILARTNSPSPYQLEYVLRALYKEMVWLGISYRERSSLCFMLGCNVNKQFTAGYSYDYTLTQLSRYSSGSHEIMLSYLIPFKKKKSASELAKDADEEELNKIDNTLKTNLRNKKKKESESGDKKEPEKETSPGKGNDPEPGKEHADPADGNVTPADDQAGPGTEKSAEPETNKQKKSKRGRDRKKENQKEPVKEENEEK